MRFPILEGLNRLLLGLFPTRFRRRNAEEIQALLCQMLCEGSRQGGRRRVLLTGTRALYDTLRHLPTEHSRGLAGSLSRVFSSGSAPQPPPSKEQTNPMESFWQDIRYGVRGLAKRPGFTLTAVLTLAIGIGANSAIFTLVNAALLRPLVVKEPQRLVGLYSRDTEQPDSYRAFSYPNYYDLREDNDVFAVLAAHNPAMVGVTEGETTRRIFADLVSSNYFAALGVPLFMGREFSAQEERPGSALRSVIVSHSFWQDKGADPDFVGAVLQINGRPFTVVGITPPGFTGTMALVSPDFYFPLGTYEIAINDFTNRMRRPLNDRANHDLMLLGRLREGLTMQQAEAHLAVAASRLQSAFPDINRNQALQVAPLSRLSISTQPHDDSEIGAVSLLLMSMSGLVLLIACLNLASMQGARGASRQREMAVRMALGSGRLRVVRQLLTEGLLLSILGGAFGLAAASAAPALLVASLQRLAPITLVLTATPDWRIIGVTLGFCLLSTVLFGLGPALRLSRREVAGDLKETQLTASGGSRRKLFRGQNFPVLAETALALTLLIVAGLFTSGAFKAVRTDPGFQVEGNLVAEVDAGLAGFQPEQGRQIYLDLLSRLRGLPGVRSASLAATVPFGMTRLGQQVEPAGTSPAHNLDPESRNNAVSARFNIVAADYFRTMGLPLLQGRTFLASEEQAGEGSRAVIIDEDLARRLWEDGEALGKWVRFPSKDPRIPPREMEVVGIVANYLDDFISATPNRYVYVPFGAQYQSDMHLQVRTEAAGPEAVEAMLSTMQKEIRAAAPALPLLSLKSMRSQLEGSPDLWVIKSGAQIFSLFGALAMFLAMVGVYGVRAYSVARRRREIGIRMALGSTRRETMWLVLREGLGLTAVGSLLGLALALAVGQLIAGFLYNVRPTEPLVFLAAPLILAAVSMLACYLPARRASRVDPVVALRCE